MLKSAQMSQELRTLFPSLLPDERSTGTGVVLGIGAFGHDAAAAIVDCQTNQVLFAEAEERLTNKKHDWHYPIGSILACCNEASRLGKKIEHVAVNFCHEQFVTKTLFTEVDRICGDRQGTQEFKNALVRCIESGEYFSVHDLECPTSSTTNLLAALGELGLTAEDRAEVLRRMTWYFNWSVKYKRIAERLEEHCSGFPVHYVNHHLAHAASTFYSSGFEDSAVLIIDGTGEAETVTIYRGKGLELELESRTPWPHSLGIFYLWATQHLGFGLGDEYKVMGMSAYGKPTLTSELSRMMRVTRSGVLELQETPYQKFGLMDGLGHLAFQFTDALDKLVPKRSKQDPITQIHFDFAASVQKLTEEMGVELARAALRLTGCTKLAIAGGVGLNGLMNEQIRTRSGCSELFIYPAAGDDGTAVGAAQWVVAQELQRRRKTCSPARLGSCYFGHQVTPMEAERALIVRGIRYSKPTSIHEEIAKAISQGHIVARCHDRSEFGPRALGHRSILAHPGLATMKETLNGRVKHREEFRPFAPACLRERVSELFELNCDAPFMLLITQAKPHAKNLIPAVVHEDGTARVQSVSPIDHPDFYQTISAFERITGLPVLLNTSFNVNGETIVDTAIDAIESFGFMDIDYLALGPYWISKVENQSRFPSYEHDQYLLIRQERFQMRNLGDLAELDISKFDSAFFNVEEAAKVCARSMETLCRAA